PDLPRCAQPQVQHADEPRLLVLNAALNRSRLHHTHSMSASSSAGAAPADCQPAGDKPDFPNRRPSMRRVTALCVAAGVALSAIATVSPAQAAFHLIKWSGNDLCQVWDDSIP